MVTEPQREAVRALLLLPSVGDCLPLQVAGTNIVSEAHVCIHHRLENRTLEVTLVVSFFTTFT